MRRLSLLFVLALLAATPLLQRTFAAPGDPIDNVEQRVTEHGFRFGAEQFLPDISGNTIVWQDQRGDSVSFNDPVTGGPRNRIWSKNLATRDESPVTTLATQYGHPRVSGAWVVWHDFEGGDHDIFARQLPSGPVVQVTTNTGDQMNPAIYGNVVVWEDYRNGNADIFRKNLVISGSETPVVVAKGNQVAPSIWGGTVAWRDSRRGPTTADVWVRSGADPPALAARIASTGVAKSFSRYQVAVSGLRLLWNEARPGCTFDCGFPKLVKTCVLPAPCGSVTTVDTLPAGRPDDALTDIDVSGNRGGWANQENVYTVDLATCEPAPCAPKAQVGVVGFHLFSNARVDGDRFAWAQPGDPKVGLEGGLDILWDNVANSPPPLRANSLGLGPFGQHLSPAASGNVVVYRAPGEGDPLNLFQVWATDLNAPRRHFAVSTELGSDTSRPALVGLRAAWSDLRNCPAPGGPQLDDPCEVFPADDVFQRTPLNSGAEVRLSNPEQTGGPVDADGVLTAWRCGDTPGVDPVAICIHNGSALQRIDVSTRLLDPESNVSNLVRISGNKVAWQEFLIPADGEPDARLHVLNRLTLDDEIVGQGADVVGEVPDFDIWGTRVVWAGTRTIGPEQPPVSTIFRNFTTGCGGGGTSCDHTGTAAPFETAVLDRVLSSPALGGTRAAWVDCDQFSALGDCDVYTRVFSELESHLVTNDTEAFVASPFVDAVLGRIYWVDGRHGNPDVFMEAVDPAATLPGPDTTAPGAPTGFAAVRSPARVVLSWTNPVAPDFFRVRILRKSGSTPPASLDDTSAAVVYEGNGSSFTDIDVGAVGLKYSYAIFAFDLQPNYSPRAVASTS